MSNPVAERFEPLLAHSIEFPIPYLGWNEVIPGRISCPTYSNERKGFFQPFALFPIILLQALRVFRR
jgi:hypothetical protein